MTFVRCPNSPWKPESEEIVTLLHAEGKSSRSIAVALCDSGYNVTRNAVIGKIHRMKLPPRVMDLKFKSKKERGISYARKVRAPVTKSRPEPRPPAPLPDTPPVEIKAPVPFIEISDGQCKAIVAYQDSQLSKAICCGSRTKKVIKGTKVVLAPWCDYHMEIYTQRNY